MLRPLGLFVVTGSPESRGKEAQALVDDSSCMAASTGAQSRTGKILGAMIATLPHYAAAGAGFIEPSTTRSFGSLQGRGGLLPLS